MHTVYSCAVTRRTTPVRRWTWRTGGGRGRSRRRAPTRTRSTCTDRCWWIAIKGRGRWVVTLFLSHSSFSLAESKNLEWLLVLWSSIVAKASWIHWYLKKRVVQNHFLLLKLVAFTAREDKKVLQYDVLLHNSEIDFCNRSPTLPMSYV